MHALWLPNAPKRCQYWAVVRERYPDLPVGSLVPGTCYFCWHELSTDTRVAVRPSIDDEKGGDLTINIVQGVDVASNVVVSTRHISTNDVANSNFAGGASVGSSSRLNHRR
jgi:hypothetical protein